MQQDEYEKLFEHEDRYWWFVSRRELTLRLLRRFSFPQNDRRLLDLGCGTGAVLAELQEFGPATGADMSSHALAYCRQRGLTDLVEADAEALPFVDGRFSAIVALDIFEHVRNDKLAFSEAGRCLQPGGILVLSVPAFRSLWGPHDVALMHFRRYRLAEIRACLEEAGLNVELLSYSVFFLFPVVAGLRLIEKFRRGPAQVRLPRVSEELNRFLIRLQRWEGSLLLRFPLPWGSSIVAVARRPVQEVNG